MATNIPPHHLGEVADATIALIEDPDLTSDDLCEFIKGPDFPTGGTIFRFEQVRNAITGQTERIDAIRQMYAHGKGRVVVRAQVAFEETRKERLESRLRALENTVAALQQQVAQLIQLQRQSQQKKRGWW